MILDYHIHTPYCGHAHGKITEYIESAIDAGMSEIAFTDHLGRYYLSSSQRRRHFDWGMDKRALRKYFEEVTEVKDAYEDSISIKIGLEVDFVEGAEDLLGPLTEAYEFDFFLGSIHCLPRFSWRHLADAFRVPPEELYKDYFVTAQSLMRSGLFHSMAHIDFIWRYVKWPNPKHFNVFDEIIRTVACAEETGLAMEVNANGFLWSQIYQVRGGDPFELFIDEARSRNVPLSIGSDAHSPKHVGKNFAQLLTYLRERGITEIARFDQGTRIMTPLG